MKILYVSWDGPEQSYMESLFLPIFGRLQAQQDHLPKLDFTVLQYAWDKDPGPIAETAARLGIGYEHRDAMRKPLQLATAAMIAKGAWDIAQIVEARGIDVIMPRSIIPAAMTLLAERYLEEPRILFDADGLMADERVDFSGWSADSLIYRLFRDLEAQILRRADAVITRTRRCREILIDRAGAGTDPDNIVVVTNPKDEEAFAPAGAEERAAVRARYGVDDDAPWIVYVGSLGPQYYPERNVAFFEQVRARRPDARMLILTGQPDAVAPILAERGLDDVVQIDRVPADQVPAHLGAADLGLALREPSFSQRGVAPIKIGEYLLCGLPVLATAGVGDTDLQLDDAVGRALPDVDDARLAAAAEWFTDQVLPARGAYREACRQRGLEHFGMARCLDAYREAFWRCTPTRRASRTAALHPDVTTTRGIAS